MFYNKISTTKKHPTYLSKSNWYAAAIKLIQEVWNQDTIWLLVLQHCGRKCGFHTLVSEHSTIDNKMLCSVILSVFWKSGLENYSVFISSKCVRMKCSQTGKSIMGILMVILVGFFSMNKPMLSQFYKSAYVQVWMLRILK